MPGWADGSLLISATPIGWMRERRPWRALALGVQLAHLAQGEQLSG